MIFRSDDNNFTVASKLPFFYQKENQRKFKEKEDGHETSRGLTL